MTIDMTPAARRAVSPDDYALILAEAITLGVRVVHLSADGGQRPYRARLDSDERSATSYESPLAAFRLAVDRRQWP